MAGPLLGTSEPVSIRALNGKKPPIGSLVILLKRLFVPQQPDPNGGTPEKNRIRAVSAVKPRTGNARMEKT